MINEQLTTTGIGSLPFADGAEAADFVFEDGPDIVFWPQIPRRSSAEGMIPQYASAMPCVRWDDEKSDTVLDTSDKYAELEDFYGKYLADDPELFPLPKDRAAGFYAFEKALGQKDGVKSAKGQVTGPLTFTTGISDAEGNTVYGDSELRDAAVKLLERNACWQVQRLKKLGAENVVIFADEPVLSAYGSSAYVGISEEDVTGLLRQIFSAISETDALPGLHVCGNSDWGMAMRSGTAILNFDTYQYGTTLALYADELERFLENGGLVAWGIVPTTDDVENESVESLATIFDEALEALESKGFDRKRVLKHSMLTPSCGAGSLDIERTRKAFGLLRELKTKLGEEK